MGGRFWRRQFPAAATDTSPTEVHSKFSRRNEAITRACTGKLSMRAETQSWPMPMRTCACHLAENLFLRQCIILCASTVQMECTLVICQDTLRRTAVHAYLNNMRLRFSTWSASE